MDEGNTSPDELINAVHKFDQDRRILKAHEGLIVWGAVAKMKAQLYIVWNSRREPCKLSKCLLLVVVVSLGEVVLEQQNLLADIELNR